MTSSINSHHVIERDNVLSFAEATLTIYSQSTSTVRQVSHIANHIVRMITVVFAIGMIMLAIPVLSVLIVLLCGLLIYSVLILSFGRSKSWSYFETLDRKDLIDMHVKVKKTIRKWDNLKNSKLLFRTPILGRLMTTYYRNLNEVEALVRAKAYPNYNIPPKNVAIHEYDPNNVWQTDQSDLVRIPRQN